MKDIGIVFASVAAAAVLSGCAAPVIRENGDEIRQSCWSFDGGQTQTRLSFDGDCAEMFIRSAGGSDVIKGLCVIDDKRMVIVDEDETYSFDYKLKGKTLALYFGGGELELTTADAARSSGEAP